MAHATEQALQSFVKRLEREMSRLEKGTVALGGFVKVCTAFEAFLKTCFGELPNSEQTKVRGPGELLHALSRATSFAGVGTVCRRVVLASKNHKHVVYRLAALRNKAAHDEQAVDYELIRRVLVETHAWARVLG